MCADVTQSHGDVQNQTACALQKNCSMAKAGEVLYLNRRRRWTHRYTCPSSPWWLQRCTSDTLQNREGLWGPLGRPPPPWSRYRTRASLQRRASLGEELEDSEGGATVWKARKSSGGYARQPASEDVATLGLYREAMICIIFLKIDWVTLAEKQPLLHGAIWHLPWSFSDGTTAI